MAFRYACIALELFSRKMQILSKLTLVELLRQRMGKHIGVVLSEFLEGYMEKYKNYFIHRLFLLGMREKLQIKSKIIERDL